MVQTYNIELRDRVKEAWVPARLIDPVDAAFGSAADAAWNAFLYEWDAGAARKGAPSSSMEHRDWHWETFICEADPKLFPATGIEAEGKAQGLMQLDLSPRSALLPESKGQPIIYVNYLAVAHWNNRGIVGARQRFAGVGSILLAHAVARSVKFKMKGRIGLHALPQAEAFYVAIGMNLVAFDQAAGYKYYEFSSGSAQSFLNGKPR